jgi:putative (di)nucleoside polyphosphate hydrolase
MPDEKPFRPNVGIALFNASGQILIGRRFRDDGPEIILPGLEWQMPQGGIDADENPRDAVMRELWEEIGVVNATFLGETDWLSYDFPPYAGPSSHRLAKFRGQRQKWFALRFAGSDDEIDPLTPRNGQPAELMPGDGSGSTVLPISWCRSGATSTARWPSFSRNSQALPRRRERQQSASASASRLN